MLREQIEQMNGQLNSFIMSNLCTDLLEQQRQDSARQLEDQRRQPEDQRRQLEDQRRQLEDQRQQFNALTEIVTMLRQESERQRSQ